jgi:hypothetical protein
MDHERGFRLTIKHGECTRNPLERINRATPTAKETDPGQKYIEASTTRSIRKPAEPKRDPATARSRSTGLRAVAVGMTYLIGAREGDLLELSRLNLEVPSRARVKVVPTNVVVGRQKRSNAGMILSPL